MQWRWPVDGAVADSDGGIAPRGPVGVWRATIWSIKGLRAAWDYESSFRLEVYLFVLLAPVAWWLAGDAIERVLLIGSMLLVLAAELLNSAIEALIERYGPEHHVLAGRAKDMGSAAVLLSLLLAGSVWLAALYTRFFT